MKILKLPITAGYDEQADPKLVGAGYVNMENLHNLNEGALTLRNGFGSAVEISSKNALDLVWWIEPVSKVLYWIGYDYDSSKQIFRLDSNFGSSSVLETISTSPPNRVNIYNYGTSVRMAKDIYNNASVYQKIDRNFFNNGISFAHFQFSGALITNSTITLIDTDGLSKTYKALSGATHDFTGATEGGSRATITVNDTGSSHSDGVVSSGDFDGDILLIKGLKSDGSTLDISYKFENDGTKSTGDTDSSYTYVDIENMTTQAQIAQELATALQHENGHNGLIGTSVENNIVYLRQTVAGSSGDLAITYTDTSGGSFAPFTKTDFSNGSSSTNILVRSNSNTSGSVVDNTVEEMAIELKNVIDHKNGHNGGLTVTANVASDRTTTLAGGIYIRQTVYKSTTPTAITVNQNFTFRCTVNPPATFSTGIGYSFDNFHYDSINYPRIENYVLSEPTSSSGGTLPFTADSKNVHYKISPVFDGLQEGLMSEETVGPINFSGSQTNSVNFTLKVDQTTYNPRLTSINVYRSITDGEYPEDGTYYFIKSIDVISSKAGQWIASRFGFKGRSLFSAWDTDDFTVNYSADTYTRNNGLLSADSSMGANAVSADEGDLFKDSTNTGVGDNTFIFADTNWTATNWATSGTVDETLTRKIKFAGKRFVQLDDDTSADKFAENKNWMICSDNFCNTTNTALVARGAGQWGTFDSTTGLTVHTDSTLAGGSLNLTKSSGGVSGQFNHVLFITDNPMTGFMGGSIFCFSCEYSSNISANDRRSEKLEIIDFTSGTAGSDHTVFETTFTTVDFNSCKRVYYKIPSTMTAFKIRFTVSHKSGSIGTGGSDVTFAMKSMVVSQIKRVGTKEWTHQSMWAIDGASLGKDSAIGKRAIIDGSSFFVSDNIDDVFRNTGNSGFLNLSEDATKNRVINGAESNWEKNGNEHTVTFIDAGLGSLNTHPLAGVTSLDTRYKFSDTVNGRTFGCNVNLFDTVGESNAYDDMVIYSELQQPDVMPISNYIKLNDLQGGAIVGVAGLMSDLVVFAERGIFRLSVPSANPSGWSLIESEPNLGCDNTHSIKKWKNGVFFAGKDNIYYITPNFEFISLTEGWREAYQSAISTITETVLQSDSGGTVTEGDVVIDIDNNNERLLVRLPGEPYKIRILDLKVLLAGKILWYDYVSDSFHYGNSNKHTGASFANLEGKIHSFIVRNDSKVYVQVISANGLNTKLRELDSGNFTNGDPRMFLKTGYITLSNSNEKLLVGKLNFHCSTTETVRVHFKIDKSSTDVTSSEDIGTFDFYKDVTGSGNQRSVRVGRRAKGIEILFETIDSTANSLQIKDIELEIS